MDDHFINRVTNYTISIDQIKRDKKNRSYHTKTEETENVRASPYSRRSDMIHKHPHCMEAGRFLFTPVFQDILCHGQFPRRKYVPRYPSRASSVLHLGQRKLLMSEIGALLRLNVDTNYVIIIWVTSRTNNRTECSY